MKQTRTAYPYIRIIKEVESCEGGSAWKRRPWVQLLSGQQKMKVSHISWGAIARPVDIVLVSSPSFLKRANAAEACGLYHAAYPEIRRTQI